MKVILLFSILIIGLLVLSTVISTAKTETQKYETLYKQGNFEIRYYPEAILATVTMNGSYDDSRNSGFRILANYIFGGNKENQKIAMTSPVRISNGNELNTMSFVLPSKMEFDKLPEPISERIILHQSEPVYAAVIQYGGYTNNKEITQKKIQLVEVLNNLNIEHNDNFEYLGYNPPYQMINRKNEVLVELNNFNPKEFKLLH